MITVNLDRVPSDCILTPSRRLVLVTFPKLRECLHLKAAGEPVLLPDAIRFGINHMRFKIVCLFVLCPFTLAAQEPESSKAGVAEGGPLQPVAQLNSARNAAVAGTEPAINPIPVFDTTALDMNADPCVDFYQYACGTWLANNPVPPDRSRWSRFDALQERNLAVLRDILQSASVDTPNRDAVDRKIGDYYAACMDEQAIDRKDIKPIRAELERIAELADKRRLADEIAHLHGVGANAAFIFSSGPDFKNSTQLIAQADQGGLGLPDRDYYLRTDVNSVETRRRYQSHVQRMFELVGDSPQTAAARAETVMKMETELAKGSLTRVERRDPLNMYHKMTLHEFMSTVDPAFDWPQYLAAVNTPPLDELNVAIPEFFRTLDSLIKTASLEDWRIYLTWHLVHSQAPLLPTAFVAENFNFYGRVLTGAKELRPRWKQCVSLVDADLGEALGQKYVQQTFSAEGKQRTLQIVRQIEKALSRDIMELAWMSPATKQKALEKLHEVTNKIGYPNKWRNYSSVKIVRDDALGNSERATEFEFHRVLSKIGKPVDRGEWEMLPQTVNAYYDPQLNSINFPAGILQPPFFDRRVDDSFNFGAIGSVIGHELTHGFDDQGRLFDGKGNLQDWWTPEDTSQFEQRTECLVKEYDGFTAVDDVRLNGRLTLGENIADNGGLRLAYMALLDDIAANTLPKIDGFTLEQRFFVAYGQSWCANETDEAARLSALTNPHSPGRYRTNGVLQNMPQFQSAFGCHVGQPMVRKPPCRVW
jgi:endothelin-converting enzyme/putative endopeptidase